MKHSRWTTIGAICVAVVAFSACSRVSEGDPVADPSDVASSTTSAPRSTATSSTTSTSTTATGNFEAPPFGVVPTTRAPIPAGEVTCSPPVRSGILIVAKVADPQAPEVTVPVPAGWTVAKGSGDVATRMNGPDGASATVTIAATPLDAAAAFRAYSDQISEKWSISALSFLPGELCDYSGQKLQGSLSNTPEDAIQFVDRIVHVWTNAKDYLVAIHVQAPARVKNLDAASDELTDDFEVRIP